MSKEVVGLLFERGAFEASDTSSTALVLAMYLIGLLPYGLSKIFSLWLYSKHKQKEAAKIASYSLGVNITLSLLLIYPLKAAGLALASSIAGFVLFVFTIKEFGAEKFFGFMRLKKIAGLILMIILEAVILLIFKMNFLTA